jgi:epoxyqueuosine reductase
MTNRGSRQSSQEVCPFNRRFSEPAAEPAYAARAPGRPPFGVQSESGFPASHPGTDAPSLIGLLEIALDDSAWDCFSRGSAIRRAGRAGFARNVCVALGNWGSAEAVPVLSAALSDPEPLVRAHAAWALGLIPSGSAIAALEQQGKRESDPSVSEELSAALAS